MSDEVFTCPFGDVETEDVDALIAHLIVSHSTEVRPSDLSVIRERMATDMIRSLHREGDGPLATTSLLVEDAMQQIEHLIADRFPPGSHTFRTAVPMTDKTADTLPQLLHLWFLGILDRIEVDQREQRWTTDPNGIEVTLSLRPTWGAESPS